MGRKEITTKEYLMKVIEVAKHLEQVNAKQKGKKRRIDRDGR